jgi:hypothetical protein
LDQSCIKKIIFIWFLHDSITTFIWAVPSQLDKLWILPLRKNLENLKTHTLFSFTAITDFFSKWCIPSVIFAWITRIWNDRGLKQIFPLLLRCLYKLNFIYLIFFLRKHIFYFRIVVVMKVLFLIFWTNQDFLTKKTIFYEKKSVVLMFAALLSVKQFWQRTEGLSVQPRNFSFSVNILVQKEL